MVSTLHSFLRLWLLECWCPLVKAIAFGARVFPWLGLACLGAACGEAQTLFFPVGKFERVLGLGPVSLQFLLQRMVLGTEQSWVEGSRRPRLGGSDGVEVPWQSWTILPLGPASHPPHTHSGLLRATQMSPTLAALDIAGCVPFCGIVPLAADWLILAGECAPCCVMSGDGQAQALLAHNPPPEPVGLLG